MSRRSSSWQGLASAGDCSLGMARSGAKELRHCVKVALQLLHWFCPRLLVAGTAALHSSLRLRLQLLHAEIPPSTTATCTEGGANVVQPCVSWCVCSFQPWGLPHQCVQRPSTFEAQHDAVHKPNGDLQFVEHANDGQETIMPASYALQSGMARGSSESCREGVSLA